MPIKTGFCASSLCILLLKHALKLKRQAAMATLGMMYPARVVWIGVRWGGRCYLKSWGSKPLGGSVCCCPHSFIALAFQNRLKDRNANFRRLNGNDSSISSRNLPIFRPVNSESTRLKCIQLQSSITTTWVSLTAFVRWRHCGAVWTIGLRQIASWSPNRTIIIPTIKLLASHSLRLYLR